MPGLGKTTLAGKIFHDPDIKYEFTTRVWVYVSQEFTEKEVFLSILRQMKTQFNEDEYTKKRCSDLAKETSALLGEAGKFLLVMDDVWETTDWDKIKECLPEDSTRGKVMITSRQMDVGKHVNRFREPHPLRKLDLEESCELLQWEVFKKPEFPPELKRVGREIAAKCDGLPLAIVVIGGVLATKFSKSETQMGESFYEYFEWKLIRMWIAEGLIQPKDGITMKEVAGYNLDDLINRNLVMAAKFKADGRVKSCRIHDRLRDLCRVEGGKESDNFYQEIKWCSDGGLQPSVTEAQKHRRLCIHSHVMDFFGKNLKGPYVRSFVTFSEDIEVPLDKISAISSAFKLLRVLEAKHLKFSRIPKDFHELFHTRYLALSLKSESNSTPSILPSTFKKLWNIQTLIVDTTSRSLDIKADVMSMTQLRHLKTNVCTTLLKPGKYSKEGEKLQTLSTVSPESCTEAIFDRARNLIKLGIRGILSSFLNSKTGTFDCLTKLSYLEKLKLQNDVYPKAPSLGKLDSLPPAYKFLVNLTSLTLQNTFLEWTNMSTLGSLQKLKVLKLKDKAFVGTRWEAMERCFNALEVLHTRRTDLLIWTASSQHFPSLKQLQLHNCEKLKEVPIGLADNPNLECLDLHSCVEVASCLCREACCGEEGRRRLNALHFSTICMNLCTACKKVNGEKNA
ncbi:hypothetical protein SASPL_154215 [Salvia splendens]|uniref:NB-ARC domain-containing protein n=1 Tax=Salvia splendens TaxID=180675 RepID=A0A8X8VZP6_SALSN|nr:hypothetical protein SASPL_154215 [Salvia splendens]